jgi:hypothetical protein
MIGMQQGWLLEYMMSFSIVFSPFESFYKMRHHDKSSVYFSHEGCHTHFYDVVASFAYRRSLRSGSVLFMTASNFKKDPESAQQEPCKGAGTDSGAKFDRETVAGT